MVSCVQLYLMRPVAAVADGGGGVFGATKPEGRHGLEGTLARAIVLCVCTVSASFEVCVELYAGKVQKAASLVRDDDDLCLLAAFLCSRWPLASVLNRNIKTSFTLGL